jgi:hypothetical protein
MRRQAATAIALLAWGCGHSPTDPQRGPSALTITAVTPAAGSTVVVPAQYPYQAIGGVVLPPDSSLLSVNVTIRLAHDLPWAQLYVYLLTDTDTGYCGQNLPDAPTWGTIPAGWTQTVTVSGFQVYGLPCTVTGVRAIFHTRNNGLLTPPTSSETIAEATLATRFQITR